jgi:hypothetical protein
VALRDQLAAVAAFDVFQKADRAGQVVTMELVTTGLLELRGHRDDCRCGGCAPARVAKPAAVYAIASGWQRECSRTRARGALG